MPALLGYPSRHPIGRIQWWTAPPEASESRTLAPSVEQKIYLKDTLLGPDRDQLAFRVAERAATESFALPDPAPVPMLKINFYFFLSQSTGFFNYPGSTLPNHLIEAPGYHPQGFPISLTG